MKEYKRMDVREYVMYNIRLRVWDQGFIAGKEDFRKVRKFEHLCKL